MFGNVDWRARLLLVLGAGLMVVGAFVRSLALPLAFVGFAVITAGALLDRYLKKRPPGSP